MGWGVKVDLFSPVLLCFFQQQRAQVTVLKKAVIEEQGKTKTLQVQNLSFRDVDGDHPV